MKKLLEYSLFTEVKDLLDKDKLRAKLSDEYLELIVGECIIESVEKIQKASRVKEFIFKLF